MRLILDEGYSATQYELSDEQLKSLLELDAEEGQKKIWTFDFICGYDFDNSADAEANSQLGDEYSQAKNDADYVLDLDENREANWDKFIEAMKVRLELPSGPDL